jgi:pathogenesis-related protein 1
MSRLPLLRRCITAAFLAALATLARSASALDFEQQTEILAAHNRWRQAAGVPGLQWSPTLAVGAQKWADELQASRGCAMQHSGIRGQGENIFWASPRRWSTGKLELQPVTPMRVVDAWGNEKADYDYAGNTCAPGKDCGHYTQLVWKTTTAVGCARAVCGDYSQVWVCQYTPPGNWRGQRPF